VSNGKRWVKVSGKAKKISTSQKNDNPRGDMYKYYRENYLHDSTSHNLKLMLVNNWLRENPEIKEKLDRLEENPHPVEVDYDRSSGESQFPKPDTMINPYRLINGYVSSMTYEGVKDTLNSISDNNELSAERILERFRDDSRADFNWGYKYH